MTYTQQLEHPKWQLKRLKIIKRDKATCQECGCKEKQLHVHHKRYIYGRMAWEYQDWELTTLCKDCHAIKHPKKDKKEAKLEPPKPKTSQEIRDIIRHWENELRGAELRERFDGQGKKMVTVEDGKSIFAKIRAEINKA